MNKKTKNILMSIYLLALIAMLSGATFAYFSLIKVSTVTPQIQTTTATTAWLLFEVSNSINITADSDTFIAGSGDKSDITYGRITLRTDNEDLEITHYYNIYLDISSNDFEYSTLEEYAEILLVVNGPDGIVTSIAGLDYVGVENGIGNVIYGFDITDKDGRYYIASSYPISTNTVAEAEWGIEVILVNLDASQNINLEKSFSASIVIEEAV